MQTTEIYRELDAAKMEVDGLGMVNATSLDTPEKRLAWDVAYEKATARLHRALTERAKLVQRMIVEA